MVKKSTIEEVIVIGVDFGTTYSGVAWAYSRQPENIEVITNWDSDLTHCSDEEKAPSLLKLGKVEQQDEWGYKVAPDKEALRWFKLLLLDKKDVAPATYECAELKEARRVQEASGKNAVEIVSKYLRFLWEHAIKNIENSVGKSLMAKCRFHVAITLPAIWPHYAQQRMEKAAEMAGILGQRSCGTTSVRFVSEPEAAALSALGDQANKSTVEVNSAYEECFEDSSLAHDGGLCGGIFLDKGFVELLGKKLGSSWKNISIKQKLEFINDKWEHGIKRQFRGTERTWRVDTPDPVTRSGSKKRPKGMQIDACEMLTVFDPIIQKINVLVKAQSLAILTKYGKEPKYIILVGGFGRNAYLRDCLAKCAESKTEVLQSQGSKPWVAICRGAVLYGLASLQLPDLKNVKVESRVARMSYGIIIWQEYDFLRHSSKDMVFDGVTQTWMATDQMDWLLKQGQELSAKTRARKSYVYQYLESRPVSTVSEIFYTSASHEPPTTKDDSVIQLCSVNWNEMVQFQSLPKKFNCLGEPYRVLKYDIEMTCDGRSVHFTVYYKGKAVADHKVVVDYE
ncbi:hypothetical protein E4U21_001548 [Claviceps maximensis]|nr:hypothetical protein E4U21_001548 [Claviceps maximensis]